MGESDLIRRDWSFRPPQGESYQDGTVRLAPFVQKLRGLSGTILVVGHFAINRSFLKAWLNLTREQALGVNVPHEALYLLDGRGG